MPTSHSTLAAVDLGSNSFRLQIARVEGDQLYPLDALREAVRLAAGLNGEKLLDETTQARALDCLSRFGERLRGFAPEDVRAVGTNTFRVAKNAREFLKRAEAALGFPIEIVAGREEARLIYLGAVQSLPAIAAKRMVVDIGGGSTEFIIGSALKPQRLESLYMGCVSFSMRYFSDGKLSKANMKQAEVAARMELQTIVKSFSAGHWSEAVGSSGTARALGDLIQAHGWGDGNIDAEGLEKLKYLVMKHNHVDELANLPSLRQDRAGVLSGGLAIMSAIFSELKVKRMVLANGAMRQGILYDMLGRFHHHDMRDATVLQFMKRYHIDVRQARRVEQMALDLLRQFSGGLHLDPDYPLHLLSWAAHLHELGLTVTHNGYHKHSAYVLSFADMPGFSKTEQAHLAVLVLAHRGNMEKMKGQILDSLDLAMVMALRLSVLFHRSRTDVVLPTLEAHCDGMHFRIGLTPTWLQENPLTAVALKEETKEWRKVGVTLDVESLDEFTGAMA